MSITVEQMLKMKKFTDMKIIAGHAGAKREVTSVTVMEAPDMYKWLKGGEFFVTTGYCFKDNIDELEGTIIKIKDAGASAFGIKLKRFIDVLPDSIIERANSLEFPIIQIPPDFTFIDIINPVLSAIVNDQSKRLQHSINIHKAFTQLAIQGGGIQQIINALGDILKTDVAFYDVYDDKIYNRANSDRFSSDINTLMLDELLLVYDHYPLYIDKNNYGYIIVSNETIIEDHIVEYDEIAIENASIVLKLEVQKRISYREIESRYRSEFVRDLLVNNIKTIEEVRNRSKIYDWDFSTGLISIIVDIDDFKVQYLKVDGKEVNDTLESVKYNIFDKSIKILRKYFDQVVYTTLNDKLILIIKSSNEDTAVFLNQLKRICEEIRVRISNMDYFTVTIGIGNYESSVMNVHRSYECAQRAVTLGRIKYKRNKVVFYDELGVQKLLSLIYESNESKEFYLTNLQKLIDHDNANDMSLLKTLQYIVHNDWNLKETSKEMYLHYNTIKYRFNLIKEIMNVDFKRFEQKLSIAISLELMEMSK